MRVINPATEEVAADFPEHTPQEVERALSLARAGFEQWSLRLTDHQRAKRFVAIARLLRERAESLARLMALEMGKPVAAGESEAEKCATACDYFAAFASRTESPLSDEIVESDASGSYVSHEPLGPVLAIMPWNFPLWQFFRFAAPALMMGNTAVLKHAPNVPGCAEAIEQLFRAADFPEGVLVNVRVGNERAEALVRHEAIAAVTLTGSTRAGKAVAAAAASVLKKSVLELGGSDPFIVLADADIAAVAGQAARARCINSGQSCIAAKRFIVVGDTRPFAEALVVAMNELKVGDPKDRATDLGPLARLDLLENLDGQVRRSVDAGARLLTGGRRLARKGYFYEPTVLSGVLAGMAAYDEETFGPLAAVVEAKDTDDAIRLANQTRYGLGASIWSADTAVAANLASRIGAGNVFINGMVKSDPRLPFGGIKESGWGRELGTQGMLEFTNVKTVWIK